MTSKKTKHVFSENELSELSKKKIEAITATELIKDLINKYSILNDAKYFSSKIFQTYLVFIPAEKEFRCFTRTNEVYFWKQSGLVLIHYHL